MSATPSDQPPGTPGQREERTSIEDLWAMWGVFSEGPRKAGLMARIRRHPDYREPDPAPAPQEPVASPPAPALERVEAAAPMSPAEISARRRLEVVSWTGEPLLYDHLGDQ